MKKNINIIEFIPRIIASWLSMTFFNYKELFFENNFIHYSILKLIIIFIISFIVLSYINIKIKKFDTDSLFILTNYAICTILWLKDYNLIKNNILFLISILIFYMIIILYFIKKNKNNIEKIKLSNKYYNLILSIIIFLLLIILTTIGLLRYYTYNSPNFDFGIFSQNFYYMKETLIPYSTCERNMLLSHFKVHFSPIFYFILPIYSLFQTPSILQIIQALILYSGIIPIILLCKHFKLSKNKTLIITLLYCLYPPLSCGTFYDFHENCFLLPLLLWVFYFFEKRNNKLLTISTILTLMIKEDVFIYLIIFSLYIIISRKDYKTGFKIFSISLLYFLVVSYLMDKYGLGIMSDRYENLINDNSGLIGAIKTIILNPGFALTQLLSNPNNNFDKVIYLLKLFIPICFIPFFTKKTSRYILLVPVLINILTNYTYMYDINFHYSFGISAFLLYLTILNIKDLNKNTLIPLLSLSITFTLVTYYCFVFPTFKNNIINYINNKNDYKIIKGALNKIPSTASVNSSTFFLPHLSNRKYLYEVYYHDNKTDIEYVVLDMRYTDELDTLNFYKNNEYNVIVEEKNLITILKKQ